MEDTDWLSAVIPANILQGPQPRYIYLGHWRTRESYQLLGGPVKKDVRTWHQCNAGQGLNTGEASLFTWVTRTGTSSRSLQVNKYLIDAEHNAKHIMFIPCHNLVWQMWALFYNKGNRAQKGKVT